MDNNRAQWGTRAGFILAAVGSAIGLGNIWRFPYIAYADGGGAFFLPYLIALLTAGIPILILEFTMGHKYRGSSPLTFARINKKAEWLGWWQVLISFVISTYYAVIIGWALAYAFFSFKLSWGDDTGGFLMGDYLGAADTEIGTLGGIVPNVFIPLLIVWVITLGILFKGVKKGIEVANKIFIPALLVLFMIIVIRALTLDGANIGLEALFKPDWSRIGDSKVWIDAYGQIFFSLSIAFAIMITYSSYLPKKSDITNNAFITGFSNSSFELLAGIGVFSALGFMAKASGVDISEVATAGIGLAFAVFPAIINEMPAFRELFGFLFFTSLVLAGLSSLVSISETYIAGFQDKFNISRTKAVAIGGGLSALISVLYATKGGLYILDVVDHFVLSMGVGLSGLVEVILIAWVFRKVKSLQGYANEFSDIRLGSWWVICLTVITPLLLGFMMIKNVYTDIVEPYEGYEVSFLITYGWVALGLTLVAGFLFASRRWSKDIDGENKEVS
ncbi:sodium-dependent transporter [Pseudalkalibacillus berkeleyi]|uniref:Sodium-dependent transporter n=1 Tax=Pseudalkalibacillus berkeleyi TaxID=1069813 RepID=A0ABS9H4E6_9BACL|nr:sodium-dependent transporter [Pseudalkalibacillus berkeleyi]MCF6138550.1 sodium-dependent transporter [Pseudalkalibacillus berkeleyi]